LTNQSSQGLQDANTAFASALVADPNNTQALILEPLTHLALLVQQPEFSTLLSQIGVTQTNQNVYNYDVQLPVDGGGRTLAAYNSQSSLVLDYSSTILRPALLDALSKLQRIPAPKPQATFTNYCNLTWQETTTGFTSIDYADVQWIKAFLHLLVVASYGKEFFNLQVAIQDFVDLSDGYLTMQEVLAKYPSFVVSTPGANERAQAKSQLASGLNAFAASYSLALNARRSQPYGYSHLLTLDLSSPIAVATAKTSLAQIKALAASVNKATKIPANRLSPNPLLDNQTVFLGALFKPTTSPRAWIGSDSFFGNQLVAGSLKDPTLSGIIQLSNLSSLVRILEGTGNLIRPLSQTISFTAPPTSVPYSKGRTITLSATGGGSGQPIVFSSRSKNASISGNTVTLLGVGPVVITATQSGYVPNYPGLYAPMIHPYAAAAPVTRSLVVTKGTPQITLSLPSTVGYSNGLTISVTASNTSDKPTTLASSNPKVAAFQRNGSLLIKAPGTTVIRATVPASANFNAASTNQTLTVTP
jgi:hypothetical protein